MLSKLVAEGFTFYKYCRLIVFDKMPENTFLDRITHPTVCC